MQSFREGILIILCQSVIYDCHLNSAKYIVFLDPAAGVDDQINYDAIVFVHGVGVGAHSIIW